MNVNELSILQKLNIYVQLRREINVMTCSDFANKLKEEIGEVSQATLVSCLWQQGLHNMTQCCEIVCKWCKDNNVEPLSTISNRLV